MRFPFLFSLRSNFGRPAWAGVRFGGSARRFFGLFLVVLGMIAPRGARGQTQEAPASKPGEFAGNVKTEWGRILAGGQPRGIIELEVSQWASDGKLRLPAPFPNVVSATLIRKDGKQPLRWVFNADATEVYLEMPGRAESPASIVLETAEKSGQFEDGRITFSALDARVEGNRARLETHPGNHRIGFWTEAKDAVSWEYKPTRWGSYDVELTFSADGGAGTEIFIEAAGKRLTVTRPSTGSWYRYETLPAGRFYLEKSEPFTLRAGCSKLKGAAALNLKAVTLRPAPEGPAIRQEADGAIILGAKEATTHGVLMRYEPATNKNCLGYWANPKDWAEWEFQVTRPGAFEVEVWQGCGRGHGGSDVSVETGIETLLFRVEETGHFQNFLPRKIGRVHLTSVGMHRLAVKPQRKQGGAVMDIRQVRLLPVREPAAEAGAAKLLLDPERVAFVGDSITYAGEWVEFVETYLRLRHPGRRFEFINLGLPSETVSGLSEPGHAGGAFPRPDLHERLGRLLERVRPDLVVACYGMNDGIYHPLSEDRIKKFQEGIRRLRERSIAAGARAVHVTPPTFDPAPLRGRVLPAGLEEYRSPFEGYNGVLDKYSEWLMAQRTQGWEVVDAHGAMNRFLEERRKGDPGFLLAGDGVHVNSQGHWLIAREVLRRLGAHEGTLKAETANQWLEGIPGGMETLRLVQRRQRVLKDAWLNHVGHARPGMSKGKPVEEAEIEAAGIEAELQVLSSKLHSGPGANSGAGYFPGKRSEWFGFDRYDFEVEGKPVLAVVPKKEAPGRPWVWHGEFFGHKPKPDVALLERGFHVVYMSVPDKLGSPGAVAHWNSFYRELTEKYGFAKKAALVGLSRGGLYCYNWAASNPEKTACIYGDAPVCDFKSWPGAFGKGKRSDRDWDLVLKEFGFASDAEAKAWRKNPVDNLAPLASARVPLLHVFGDADEVVPWEENTGVVAERYAALGGRITLIRKPGVKHHPHGLEDCAPIVDFIWENAASPEAKVWLKSKK